MTTFSKHLVGNGPFSPLAAPMLALALKNKVCPEIFHCVEIFFIIQYF